MSIDEFLKTAKKRQKKEQEITETEIEETFVDYAESKGCSALKLLMLNKRGFPDRTILCPGGRIFFIEFKRKDKPLTKQQSKIGEKLEGFSFKYFVCDEIGQAEKILNEFLR